LPLFGPPNIDRLEAKGDLAGLVNALEYPGAWRVRRDAAAALGRIGTAEEVEPLIAALHDDNASVRIAAIGTLGQISDRRAVGPLSGALQSQAVDIRKAAAESLGQIGDPAALESLVARLKDPCPPGGCQCSRPDSGPAWSRAAHRGLGRPRRPRSASRCLCPCGARLEAERAPRHEWGGRTQLEARAGRRHPSWPIAGRTFAD
jgi:hypothetical protein